MDSIENLAETQSSLLTKVAKLEKANMDLRKSLHLTLAWLEDGAVRYEIRQKQGNAATYDSIIKQSKLALATS